MGDFIAKKRAVNLKIISRFQNSIINTLISNTKLKVNMENTRNLLIFFYFIEMVASFATQ